MKFQAQPNPTGTSENNCPSGFVLHEPKELDFCTHTGRSVTMAWGEGGEERNRVRDGAVKFLGIFSSQGLEALAPLDVPLQMAVMSC